MKLPILAAAALLAAAPALAQTRPARSTADPRADASQPFNQVADQMRPDPTGISTNTVTPQDESDDVTLNNPTLDDRSFSRLDRDVRSLGNDPDAMRYGQQRDAIRRDYDALGTTATPEARMGVMQRYEDLNSSVGMSRMNMASRDDYFRQADGRISAYDSGIDAARRSFDSATGADRAVRAQQLIGLRRQRNMYRDEVFGVRGAGRSGFDAARRGAATNLSRYDTQFRQSQRDMMRGTMNAPAQGTQPMGTGGMRN